MPLDDPLAKTLGYEHDGSKVDAAKFPRKTDEQLCENCMLAVGETKSVDGQEGKWVPCSLFQNRLVNTKGWCNSWAKKA